MLIVDSWPMQTVARMLTGFCVGFCEGGKDKVINGTDTEGGDVGSAVGGLVGILDGGLVGGLLFIIGASVIGVYFDG